MQAKYPANFITILCLNYENLQKGDNITQQHIDI